jgi:hypothetical protein
VGDSDLEIIKRETGKSFLPTKIKHLPRDRSWLIRGRFKDLHKTRSRSPSGKFPSVRSICLLVGISHLWNPYESKFLIEFTKTCYYEYIMDDSCCSRFALKDGTAIYNSSINLTPDHKQSALAVVLSQARPCRDKRCRGRRD